MSRTETRIPRPRIAIIGAGPIGLEAGLRAGIEGWEVKIFEKGRIGEHIRKWGHVRLFTPFRYVRSETALKALGASVSRVLPDDDQLLTGEEYLQRYLKPLSRHPVLKGRVLERAEVLETGRSGLSKRSLIGRPERGQHAFRLLVKENGRERIHEADIVFDASGVFSNPQFAGNGGIAAPGESAARESRNFDTGLVDVLGTERSRFAGKITLLVGTGFSAATHLEALSAVAENAPATQVFWVTSGRRERPYDRIAGDPLSARDRLSLLANRFALTPPPWLTHLPGWTIEGFEVGTPGESLQVCLQGGPAQARNLTVDNVISNTGFQPDNSIYRQLQVHECYATGGPIKLASALLGATDCLDQPSPGIELLKNPEPGFFIIGNKSYGTSPFFLLSQGFQQIDEVFKDLMETMDVKRSDPGNVHQGSNSPREESLLRG